MCGGSQYNVANFVSATPLNQPAASILPLNPSKLGFLGGRIPIIAVCVGLFLIAFYLTSSTHVSLRPPTRSQSDRPPPKPATKADDVPAHPSESHPSPPPESHSSPAIESHSGSRPKCGLTKVSMLYGAHKYSQLEAALSGHRRHSERWGCGFQQLENDVTTRKLYSKHYFLLSILIQELSKPKESRQQWLMWVDADSILLNPAISPEIFLPPAGLDDVYALVTADHNGLNDGIFYLRVHPSSLDLITQVAAYPLTHPDEDLGWFGEQQAMQNVIKAVEAQSKAKKEHSGIAWLPRIWVNAFEWEHGFEGEPGHMLVHFAGLAETRLDHMQKWLDELVGNQAKWEIGPDKVFYKDAIADFWKEFAANQTRGV